MSTFFCLVIRVPFDLHGLGSRSVLDPNPSPNPSPNPTFILKALSLTARCSSMGWLLAITRTHRRVSARRRPSRPRMRAVMTVAARYNSMFRSSVWYLWCGVVWRDVVPIQQHVQKLGLVPLCPRPCSKQLVAVGSLDPEMENQMKSETCDHRSRLKTCVTKVTVCSFTCLFIYSFHSFTSYFRAAAFWRRYNRSNSS